MTARERESILAEELLQRLEGCPGAEDLQKLGAAELSGEETARLAGHVDRCPPCTRALQVLADTEEEPGELPPELERRTEEWIDALRPSGPSIASAWMLRAGGLLLFGAALGVLVFPRLTGPGGDLGAIHGDGRIELSSPVGVLEEPPAEMRWAGCPWAAGYRVVLLDTELRRVWSRRTDGPESSLMLDGETRAALAAGGTYSWQVRALDELGEVIARSPVAHFRVAASVSAG